MINNECWRYPSNGYGTENGLDTGDVETFKKDPNASLSRETSQNAIDAQRNKNNATKIEYRLFEIDRKNIPGIEKLTNEIEKCYEFKKGSDKEGKPLKNMKDWIHKDVIKCLRISDFNTTGLIGVLNNERGQPFYNLTRGAGVSDKLGTSGGSKGIGKFASFVASTTNTVFYSTKTIKNEVGYIGINKLRSIPVNEDDLYLMTEGTGYYARNEKNEPILKELKLDPDFERKDGEFGTDIYIIGYNDSESWKNDIIAKILDSFMVAIVKNGFEVRVDDIIINIETLDDIINNQSFFTNRYKREVKDIKAQFELLSNNEDVYLKEITIDDSNRVTVYVKRYNREEEKNANKRCIMVRYPYMKIKHTTGHSFLPYSALCIIHNNELNEKLRQIENPQHTDWEIKRLNDYPDEKKITSNLMKKLDKAINDYIREVMIQNNGESTDAEGAGDYLPSQDEEYGGGTVETEIEDLIAASLPRRVNKTNSKANKPKELGDDYEFGRGDSDGEEKGIDFGGGGNNSNPAPPNPPEPNIDPHGKIRDDGKESVIKRVQLKNISFRNIVVNKQEGRFDIIFRSPQDENNCSLKIKMFGQASDRYPINIISAKIGNEQCEVQNGIISGIKIVKDKKYKIECRLNTNELFSSEVTLYANR